MRFTPTPCPYNPAPFQLRLEEVFGSQLRLRWSVRYAAWFIEQKVGRAALPPLRIKEWDDSLICARDGYAPVMRVQPGTKMACPSCHLPLPVPVMESAEVRCRQCQLRNIDASVVTAYFPLGEKLIDHLRKCLMDPAERIRREEWDTDRQRRWADEAQDRERREGLKDALLDQLPKAGFPSLVPDAWRH